MVIIVLAFVIGMVVGAGLILWIMMHPPAGMLPW